MTKRKIHKKSYYSIISSIKKILYFHLGLRNADVPWSIVFKSFKSARVVQGVPTDTVPRDKSLRLRMKGKISV